MQNHNLEVLKILRDNYELQVGKRRKLVLPSDLGLTIDGNTLLMHLNAESVCKNMQTDSSAFEGWALVAKRWGQFQRILLSWNKPSDLKNGHYQRFLFRAKYFSKYSHSWFEIDGKCDSYLDALLIKDDITYFLNHPSTNRDKNDPKRIEGILENKFISGELHEPLVKLTNAEFINRQLPVGVFINKVARNNEIFPRSKSAIDLWGISNNDELLLFELKAERNNKVGIISELFFYSCVMQSLKDGMFKYEKEDQSLKRIATTSITHAYFLAPELHPLIDKATIDEINIVMRPKIEFHYIQIPDFSIKQIW